MNPDSRKTHRSQTKKHHSSQIKITINWNKTNTTRSSLFLQNEHTKLNPFLNNNNKNSKTGSLHWTILSFNAVTVPLKSCWKWVTLFLVLAYSFSLSLSHKRRNFCFPFVRNAAPLVQRPGNWAQALDEIHLILNPRSILRIIRAVHFLWYASVMREGAHDSTTVLADLAGWLFPFWRIYPSTLDQFLISLPQSFEVNFGHSHSRLLLTKWVNENQEFHFSPPNIKTIKKNFVHNIFHRPSLLST